MFSKAETALFVCENNSREKEMISSNFEGTTPMMDKMSQSAARLRYRIEDHHIITHLVGYYIYNQRSSMLHHI